MVSPTCLEPRSFNLRQLCVQYGIFYMHLCGLSGGKETVLLSARLLTPMRVKRTVLHIQLSP